eukprot:30136-Pelagococcus_subviridis.AAC.3
MNIERLLSISTRTKIKGYKNGSCSGLAFLRARATPAASVVPSGNFGIDRTASLKRVTIARISASPSSVTISPA